MLDDNIIRLALVVVICCLGVCCHSARLLHASGSWRKESSGNQLQTCLQQLSGRLRHALVLLHYMLLDHMLLSHHFLHDAP